MRKKRDYTEFVVLKINHVSEDTNILTCMSYCGVSLDKDSLISKKIYKYESIKTSPINTFVLN